LTSVAGLDALKLLKFGKSVAGPLIRPRHAWCSECLSEFREKKHGIYQAILWNVHDVSAATRRMYPVIVATRDSEQSQKSKELMNHQC
jgi:hypothetical protein